MTDNGDLGDDLSSMGKMLFDPDSLEEVKEPEPSDTSIIPNVGLDDSFKSAFSAAESDQDVQEEMRLTAPEPPYRILFVGSEAKISQIQTGRTGKLKMKFMTKKTKQQSEIIDEKNSQKFVLKPGKYDDETLEELIKKHIKKEAASNKYHFMMACAEDPSVSARIVKQMREKHKLLREEGFMMPYILVGEFPQNLRLEVLARNVRFFQYASGLTAEKNTKALHELMKLSLEESYQEPIRRFKILLMGSSNPYRNIEIKNTRIKYFEVSPDSLGYSMAKSVLASDNIDAVVVDSDELYQKRLVFKVRNEYTNAIPMAFASSEEMAQKYGAEQYSQEAYSTPEGRLKKLVRAMEDKLRSFKVEDKKETKVTVEFEEGLVVLDSNGKAYRSTRKKFDP
jgi:hypothetical protein